MGIIGKCEIRRRAIIHQIKPAREQKSCWLSRQMRLNFRLYFRRGYGARQVKRSRRHHQTATLHLAQTSQTRNQGACPIARAVRDLRLHQIFGALCLKACGQSRELHPIGDLTAKLNFGAVKFRQEVERLAVIVNFQAAHQLSVRRSFPQSALSTQ